MIFYYYLFVCELFLVNWKYCGFCWGDRYLEWFLIYGEFWCYWCLIWVFGEFEFVCYYCRVDLLVVGFGGCFFWYCSWVDRGWCGWFVLFKFWWVVVCGEFWWWLWLVYCFWIELVVWEGFWFWCWDIF